MTRLFPREDLPDAKRPKRQGVSRTGAPIVETPRPVGRKFALLDHVCATCGGRLLYGPSGKDKTGPNVTRCSNCGLEAKGGHRKLCGCGVLVGDRDAGLRCVVNDRRTDDSPHEFEIREIEP